MFFSSLVFVEHFFFLLLWNNFFPPQIMKTSVISAAPIGILRTCRLFHWRPPVTQVNITDLISTHLGLTIIDQLHSKCDLHNDQYCPSIVNLWTDHFTYKLPPTSIHKNHTHTMEQGFNNGEKPVCDQFLSYNGQWHRERCWDEEWASLSLVSLSESADSSLGDGCQLELVLISSHFTQRHCLLSQHLVRNPTPSSSLTLFNFHCHYKWPFSLWAVTLCLSICKSKHPLYKKISGDLLSLWNLIHQM